MDKITKVTVNGSTYQLGGNPDVSGFYKITVTLPTAPNASTLSYDGYIFPIGAVVRVQDSNSDSGYAFYRLHDITNGIAVWSKLDGGLFVAPETVTVHVASNQATNTDLIGVATVTVNGETQTYNGSDLVFYVEEGTSYTISAGSVSGYAISNDSTSTYTAVFMGSRTANITYNTEVVTVTTEMSGATLTIDGNTYTGPVKIPYGTIYTVTGSAILGYKTNIRTFVAELASRTVTVVYEELVYGVFAYYSDGSLRSYDDADTNAIGVAVIDENCSFVIDKLATNNNSPIEYGGYNKDLSSIGVVVTTGANTAKLDFDGEGNTTKIINACAGYTSGGITGAPAAEACRAAFEGKGYMGSLGEWNEAYANKASVDNIMTKIGGTVISYNYSLATSTLYDAFYYSWITSWSNNYMNRVDRLNGCRVRALKAL